MLDYKKILKETKFDDVKIKTWNSKTQHEIEILGNKKGLLYLASRLAEFVFEDYDTLGEFDLHAGIELTDDSSWLRIFKCEKL